MVNISIQYLWGNNTQNKVQSENCIGAVWKIIFMYYFLLACPMWY